MTSTATNGSGILPSLSIETSVARASLEIAPAKEHQVHVAHVQANKALLLTEHIRCPGSAECYTASPHARCSGLLLHMQG